MQPNEVTAVTATVAGMSQPQTVPLTDAVKAAVAVALTPVLPVVARKVPVSTQPAIEQYGVWVAGLREKGKDRRYADTEYTGFGNGASFQYSTGNQTFENVRLTDNWGDTKDSQGQGIYGEDTGDLFFRNGIIGWNGKPRNRPDVVPNRYRHGVYYNSLAGSVDFEDSIIIGNAAAGVQVRNPKSLNTYKRCLFIDNAIGVMSVMGTSALEDCTFLGGHLKWDGDSWTSNTALVAYWPVSLNRVKIIGLHGQDLVPTAKKGKVFFNGAISSGGSWIHESIKFVKPPAGVPLITAKDSIIRGWPGQAFGGQTPHDGSGFTVGGEPIRYDYMRWVNAALQNVISVKEAIKRINDDTDALLK